MRNFRTNRLALELGIRDWAYKNFRPRSGLPSMPMKPPRGVQESPFYQTLLQEALSHDLRLQITHWLDIGCRNWGYLAGCLAALPQLKSGTGIERDPGRLHWNGYYRGDYAQAAALGSSHPGRTLEFLAGDFRSASLKAPWSLLPASQSELPVRVALITHFFPFVSENPCQQWGLPRDYSDFTQLAARTLELLNQLPQENTPCGIWISLHQGEWEADIARSIWRGLGCTFSEKQIQPKSLPGNWPGRHPLHLLTGQVRSSKDLAL